VITGLLGEDACDATDLAQICAEGGSSDYHAADINGKLINFSSDMGDKNFSGGRFKSIASHQPIKVRPIHRDPFVARDMPLLAACINKLPITTDSSDGYWRRNKIVLFDKTIEEKDQDKSLATKILAAESPGLLNWIMEGRTRLLTRNGQFTESKRIMDTVSKAREDSSSVLSWIKEAMYCGRLLRGQMGYEDKELSTVIVEQYRDYCRKTGCLPKKMSNLKDDLEQAGFIYEKCVKKNGVTSTGWRFWKITDMDMDEPIRKEEGMVKEEPVLPF
jgi:putative DNA primase/helicase